MSIPWGLAIPVVVFIGLVAPIWIILHYVTVWKRLQARPLGADQIAVDAGALRAVQDAADKLDARIAALEAVLSDGHPGWKQR